MKNSTCAHYNRLCENDNNKEPIKLSNLHIYNMIWGIAEMYGGMTSAMLYRAKLFREFEVGKTLTIITLWPDQDVRKTERHIQALWGMPSNVKVRNIWDDLRAMSDTELLGLPNGFSNKNTIEKFAQKNSVYPTTTTYTKEFKNSNNSIERNIHLRENGSVLAIDQRSGEMKSVALYGEQGEILKVWGDIDELYISWLEYVMAQRPGVIINEDGSLGRFLYRLNIPDIKTVQVVHGSHLKAPSLAPYGEYTSGRARTVQNAASFDLIAVLTDWHMQDLLSIGLEDFNIDVIPNTTKPVVINKNNYKKPTRGVIIAQLTARKQVDHAIKALSGLSDNITLDIYGTGEELEYLKGLCRELSLNHRVEFKGYVQHAAEYLKNYSFLLFTSKAEGQGLVLLEAMASGCIPISYDMRYGPRDVISHGVDGFIVPADDLRGIRDSITSFLEMPEKNIYEMRQAAISKAESFYPRNNMKRWSEALVATINKPRRQRVHYSSLCKVSVESVSVSNSMCYLSGVIEGVKEDIGLTTKFVISSREMISFVKVLPKIKHITGKRAEFKVCFSLKSMPLSDTSILDLFMQPIGATWEDKVRISYALPEREVLVLAGRIYKTLHGNISFDFRK